MGGPVTVADIQVKSVLFIEPNITKHKFASEGFTMCPKDNTLYPKILQTYKGKLL